MSGRGSGHSGLRLVAINLAASRAGLRPGLALADARALEPALRVMPADPHGDHRALAALAGWCGQYSPWTAPSGLEADGSAGLWIDITGCDHLFGGEANLLAGLTARLHQHGYAARAAVADTPGTAWAAARFVAPPTPALPHKGGGNKARRRNPLPPRGGGPAGHLGSGRTGWGGAKQRANQENHIIPPGAQSHALAALPIAALRLTAAQCEELDRLGLRRIADLMTLPRSGLAARFGGDLVRRLDQALGDLDEPISPREPPPRMRFRMNFPEPVGRPEDILAATERLLTAATAKLETLGQGARYLKLYLYRIDATVDAVTIGTSRPNRDPVHLLRLAREKLDRLPIPKTVESNVETLLLAIGRAEKFDFTQSGLTADAHDIARPGTGIDQLAGLADRLIGKLGAANVVRLQPRESHLPERAQIAEPIAASSGTLIGSPWPLPRPRPLRLLPRPEPVSAMAPVPDDPPVLFRWRRRLFHVARADGPERLSPEWWRPTNVLGAETRDYYRVEDRNGQRFWLYRNGIYRTGIDPQWFLHGFFG